MRIFRFILGVILICQIHFAFSQHEETDSLFLPYQNAANLTNKTREAIRISHELVHTDSDKSGEFARRALSHAEESGDQLLIAEAKEAIADYFGSKSNFLEAANVYLQALMIYESLKMHKKAAAVSNNVANMYLGIEQNDKAEQYYLRSYDLGVLAQDTNAIAVPLVGLSIIYDDRGDIEKALEYTEEAAVLFEAIQRQDAILICHVNAAGYASQLGLIDKALRHTEKAKEVNKILDNSFYRGSILITESELYKQVGNYSKAIQTGEEAIQNFVAFNGAVHETKHAFKQLADVYEAAGDNGNALKYLKQYLHLSDSMDEVNRAEVMAEMDAKFNKVQNEKKIAKLSHESNLHQLENKKNKTIIYLAFGASFVLLFLLGYALRANRQKKSANEKLQQQKSIIEEKNSEILDSIQYAKRIQSAILPRETTFKKHLPNSFVIYKPKDVVAGDFYWMEEVGSSILFAAADCTGHGVPGAMVSVVCNNGLNHSVRLHGLTDPGEILNKTKEIVIEEFEKAEEDVKDGMDIALCCYDKPRRELHFAGANNPLWIIREGELIEIKGNKQPIGKSDHNERFTSHKLDVFKNDLIYIFTDGFADQFGGEKGKKMKTANFKKLLISLAELPMQEQMQKIDEAFEDWKAGFEQLDDVCVIGVRV